MKENTNEIERGFIDDDGCRRYTMTTQALESLYKKLENFVADCTVEEYQENQQSIAAVYSLIHKHILIENCPD